VSLHKAWEGQVGEPESRVMWLWEDGREDGVVILVGKEREKLVDLMCFNQF
jgi:hypothetical protein